jgi:IS5 family transposase
MEDELYEITSMRLFAELSLDSTIPDHTTIMNFRHLLEKYKLSRQLFKEVNTWLSSAGIYLKEGTIVDVTIIEAASSTKNKTKARYPEVHQTQKGKQCFFGLKAHIGVYARTSLTHSVSTTASNVHNITSQRQNICFMVRKPLSQWIRVIGAHKNEKNSKTSKSIG